ncbi:MAG: PrsW family intramembrane metalloprotease [Firmicutes bacterium]|nr:PrsW family intramembrane metalloprotease [Bacillota bacterium]
MSYIILLAVSLGPGLAWLWFFYRQDRFAPEPRALVTKSFVAGMLAVLPAALVELPFRGFITNPGSLWGLALASVFFIGLPEEGIKYLAVRREVYEHPEFDEPVDGIIYSIGVGLGFAALENLFYALSFGISIAPLRALVACLAHASFSGVLGYYLGLAKFNPDRERAFLIQGLTIAILLHAVYDLFILSPQLPGYISLVVLGSAYLFIRAKIRETRILEH